MVRKAETLREFAAQWVVVHDDRAQITGGNSAKHITAARELRVRDGADYRQVAQARRQRVRRDAVRCVESDEGRAGDAQRRLQFRVEPRPVFTRDRFLAQDVQRRAPPGYIMVARNADRGTVALRVPNECGAGQEFANARTLREVAAEHYDVVALAGDELLEGRDERRPRRCGEVEITRLEDA